MDLTDLLGRAKEDGYTRNFVCESGGLRCMDSGRTFSVNEARIVHSQSVDQGTDPGDDATLYLIETDSGDKGFVIVGDAFHADARAVQVIDKLLKKS